MLILVAVAAPREGVVNDGEVPKTRAPEPVSSVIDVAKFELDGVPKKVATPVPKPLTPVEIGKPVPFVSVIKDGIPKAGVVKVGLLDKTTLPVPVELVTPVPPFAIGSVPVTPAVSETLLIVLSAPLMVLFVSVSVPVKVASVPEVGNVTAVVAVEVSVVE